jgi:ABC-type Fe3+/spermidine/putrescine transport system ATPase subunit
VPAEKRSLLPNRPQKRPLRGVPVRRLDHVNLMARDVGAVREGMQRLLGFRLREQKLGKDNVEVGAWMSVSPLVHEIAVMRDGKVVQYASQQEVYAKPTNLYVATFVGKPKMSLIQGRLENEDDAVYFVGPSMKLRLGAPREINLNGSEASEVVAGVRAEDVGILDGDVIGPTTFRAVVSLHEPIGSDTFVELAIDGVTVVSRVAPDRRPPIGQTVTASVSAAKVHLFDAVSGARIN